jgi:hypothetical protein
MTSASRLKATVVSMIVGVRSNVYYSGDLPCGGKTGWSSMVGFRNDAKVRACVAAEYTSAHPST